MSRMIAIGTEAKEIGIGTLAETIEGIGIKIDGQETIATTEIDQRGQIEIEGIETIIEVIGVTEVTVVIAEIVVIEETEVIGIPVATETTETGTVITSESMIGTIEEMTGDIPNAAVTIAPDLAPTARDEREKRALARR
jgi:hypothetical protein